MKISKTAAESIARKALAGKKQNLETAQRAYEQFVTEKATESLPKKVLDLFKAFPEFINKDRSLRFKADEMALDYSYYKSSKSVPVPNDNFIKVSAGQLLALQAAKNNFNKLKDQYESALNSLETAIFQLGTLKRVKTELPELEKFLPSESTTALVPNMDHIRAILKS